MELWLCWYAIGGGSDYGADDANGGDGGVGVAFEWALALALALAWLYL